MQNDLPVSYPSAFQPPGRGVGKEEKESFKDDDKEDDKESQQTDEEKRINEKFPMMKFKVGMVKPGSGRLFRYSFQLFELFFVVTRCL